MHAAIIADTLRVRWIPVVCSKNINTFKWLDWLSMFDIDYTPIYLGLPNFKQEQINQLYIQNNASFYKPSFKNMTINELLTVNSYEVSVLQQEQSYWTDEFKQDSYAQIFIKKLKNIIKSKSYLSCDEIFYKRAKQAKSKLDEFIKSID